MGVVLGRGVRRWVAVVSLVAAATALAPGVRRDGSAVAAEKTEWRPATIPAVSGLQSVRIHPKAPGVLYAYVIGVGPAKSLNGGAAWTPLIDGIDRKDIPTARDRGWIALDPSDPKLLYFVARGKVYKSDNEGKTWGTITTQALASRSVDGRRSAMRIMGVVVSGKSVHLIAGTRTDGGFHGGYYESQDGGKRWTQIAGSNVDKTDLGPDAWPLAIDPKTQNDVFAGSAEGLWFSDDRGAKWKRVEVGAPGWHDVREITDIDKEMYLCDGRGLWVSRDKGKKWSKGPILAGDVVTVELDPHGKKRLFAVLRDTGIAVSEDPKHEKWNPAVGLADAEIEDLVPHPRDKDVIYASSSVTGLHVSNDRGETFKPVTAELPQVMPAVAVAAVHPDGRALAVGEYGLVFASEDRGETWKRAGRTGMTPSSLLADADAWLVGGRRLLRSRDQGKTWEVAFEPDDPEDRVLDLTRSEDGTIRFLLERERVVMTWKPGAAKCEPSSPIAATSRTTWCSALAVDPQNPDHLLVAARTLALVWSPRDEEGGPFESMDGGKTWTRPTEGLVGKDQRLKGWNYGTHAAIDPASGVLYYAASGLGLFARKPAAAPKEGDKSPPAASEWVAAGDGWLPGPTVRALLVEPTIVRHDPPRPPDVDSVVYVQVEGDNDTRAFYRAVGSQLAAHVAAAAADRVGLKTWSGDAVADPGVRVGSLAVDPGVPGRLLVGDRLGDRGVLLYGPTGPAAKPTEKKPTAPVPEVPKEAPKCPLTLVGFSGGQDKLIRAWSLSEGKAVRNQTEHQGGVGALALSPDGKVLASGADDKTVRLWNVVDGALQGTLGPVENGAAVISLAWHPKQTHLYAGLRENWAIAAWDVAAKTMKRFEGHAGGVLALAVAADGSRLYSGGEDAQVLGWDLAAGTKLPWAGTFPAEVLALALSPDGKRLYVAGRTPIVAVLSTEDGKEILKKEVTVGDKPALGFSSLALSPDGTTLYVGGAGGLQALKAEDLSPVATFAGPAKEVLSLAISADGGWLLAGDADNGIWLWSKDCPACSAWTSGAGAHSGPVRAVALASAVFPALPPAPPSGEKPADGSGEKPSEAPPGGVPPETPPGDKKPAGPDEKPAEPPGGPVPPAPPAGAPKGP